MVLNGWQRLWLVVVALWGIVVAVCAILLWPRTLYHPPNGYSEEVVSQMQIKDWKGKNDCSATPDNSEIPWTPVDITVASVIREAYPHSYDDLTDRQLEDALRSKAPELDRIVRKMIASGESFQNIVLVVQHAIKSDVKNADEVLPLFGRVYLPIDGDTALCFAGEPKHRWEQILSDYDTTHSRVLRSKQHEVAVEALAFWLVPALFAYAVGWSVGWIRRGFKASRG